MSIRDLGEHRLKDLKYPTPIYQLLIEGLPQEFPSAADEVLRHGSPDARPAAFQRPAVFRGGRFGAFLRQRAAHGQTRRALTPDPVPVGRDRRFRQREILPGAGRGDPCPQKGTDPARWQPAARRQRELAGTRHNPDCPSHRSARPRADPQLRIGHGGSHVNG